MDLRDVVRAYADGWRTGDKQPWLELFAEDARLIDPVGTTPHEGKVAISELWDSVHARMQLDLLIGRIVVCGREVAMQFELHVEPTEGRPSVIDVVDVFEFDDDDKITCMRAYWDRDCIRRATINP